MHVCRSTHFPRLPCIYISTMFFQFCLRKHPLSQFFKINSCIPTWTFWNLDIFLNVIVCNEEIGKNHPISKDFIFDKPSDIFQKYLKRLNSCLRVYVSENPPIPTQYNSHYSYLIKNLKRKIANWVDCCLLAGCTFFDFYRNFKILDFSCHSCYVC